MITDWEAFEARIEELQAATYEIEDPANLIRDFCNIVRDLAAHVKGAGSVTAYPGRTIKIIPNFIMDILDHQLIGARVQYRNRSFTITGARRKKYTNEVEFRLLGLDTRKEEWTEADPTFEDMQFKEFKDE